MKYFAWTLIISLNFILILPASVFAQCEPPFIDCNGLCTLPDECSSGGPGGGVGQPPGGGGVSQPPGGSLTLTNPIQSNTFADVMAKVADIAAKIGLPLVVVFIIYAGFLFVSARGDEEKLTKAKTTFFWAVIGALLVVGAFAISLAIENFAKQL